MSGSPGPESQVPRSGLVIAGLAVLAAYQPALSAFFVKDDLALLSSATLELPAVFLHSWPGGFFRPTAELFFGVQYALFGLHSLPYHLVSLLIHFLAVWLVYRIVWLLTEHRQKSLVAAGYFALHPLNTESVSWIAGQMSLGAGASALAVIYLLLSRPIAHSLLRSTAVLAIFAAGLACYENLMVVPLLWVGMLLGCKRLRPQGAAQKVALALALVIPLATYLIWRSLALGLGAGYYEFIISARSSAVNLVYYLYLLGGGSAIGGRIINYHPGQLWGDAAFEVFTPVLIANLLLFLGAAIYMASDRITGWGRRSPDLGATRCVLLAAIWIVIALLPALVLDQRPRRLAYLAVPGYALLVAEGIYYLKQKTCPSPVWARAGLIGGILLLLTTLWLRNQDWRRAGELEERLPVAVQSAACANLVFDVPDLLGDALFFNSASTAFWLARQIGRQEVRVFATHQLAEAGSMAEEPCNFRYQENQFRPVASTSAEPFPFYVKGRNWELSGH